MDIQLDEGNKEKESAYQFGNNLFKKEQNNRNTKLIAKETGVLSVLRALADIQDTYRHKYKISKKPCNLTLLINPNFEIRSAVNGWRSSQVEEILKAGKIEQVNQDNKGLVIPARRF